jgi:hypothetical protein
MYDHISVLCTSHSHTAQFVLKSRAGLCSRIRWILSARNKQHIDV